MNRSKAIAASYIGVLVYAAIIFLAAGTLHSWQAILYVVLALIGTLLNQLLEPKGSNLIVERASRVREGEEWDKKLLRVYFLLSLLAFVVAGLDSGRFGWSAGFPMWLTVAGAVLMLAGSLLFAFAKRENAFFSSIVRIQGDRGHAVCETGPYRVVRHPGYLGMLLSLLSFPLVMSSWWAFVPACMAAGVLVARTVLEDRYLMEKLSGYTDYASRTKWRLIPAVF